MMPFDLESVAYRRVMDDAVACHADRMIDRHERRIGEDRTVRKGAEYVTRYFRAAAVDFAYEQVVRDHSLDDFSEMYAQPWD